MHILLAEDNDANRILVRSLLEREGHILDFAQNGAIALMCCEDQKYDLILMDILMPIMDGVKTLRKLRRSNNPNAHTPVFALTAYRSEADKRRYRQVGFDLVLSKPLRPNELGQAWNRYLNGDNNFTPKSLDIPSQDFENMPFIDDDIIGQLLISGSPDEIRHIAKRFWDSLHELMCLIHNNLALAMRGQNEALSNLRKASHGVNGSAATIGLMRLSRIAASLQNAPPDKIGPLVLYLTDTIKPSALVLDQRISLDSDTARTDSAGVRVSDVNARIKPIQSPPSLLESQSRHKISREEAHPRQALAP